MFRRSIPIDIKTRIQKILDGHALKAAASEYDRSVCITAVATARSTVSECLESSAPHVDTDLLLRRLLDLQANYHDPDGEYTSGKGVIGVLIADIHSALKRKDP